VAKEFLLKFVLGGAIVSLFAVAGEAFKPKHFAGIFGAAPSVALASLALAYAEHGAKYVTIETRAMIAGSIAFFVYGAACVAGAKREGVSIPVLAVASWGVWFAVAFSLCIVGRALGWLG
jgi:uncharacterized membrane protein (GlpM family)